jgi:iron complex transport system ATP-binding protein
MRPQPRVILDFKNLTVTRGEKSVLRNFSLQVRAGEHLAILGPNGSGKSTLIKLMTGELHPLAGMAGTHARLFGQEHWALDDVRRCTGIVALDLLASLSHEVTTREVTAREMVLSGYFNSVGLWPHHRVSPRQERRARAVLRFLEITRLADIAEIGRRATAGPDRSRPGA